MDGQIYEYEWYNHEEYVDEVKRREAMDDLMRGLNVRRPEGVIKIDSIDMEAPSQNKSRDLYKWEIEKMAEAMVNTTERVEEFDESLESLTPEEQAVADRLEELIERHLDAGYKGPETKSIHLNLPEATPRILAYLCKRFTAWNIGPSEEGGPGNFTDVYSFEPK